MDYKKKLRLAYLSADLVSGLATWILFLGYRWIVNDNVDFSYPNILVPIFNYYTPLFVFPIACLWVHSLSGYYLQPYKKTVGGDITQTLISSLFIAFGAFFAIIIDDIVIDYQAYYHTLVALFCFQFVNTLTLRVCITLHTRKVIRNGEMAFNVAIVGTGKKAKAIAKEMEKELFGRKVVGYITTDRDLEQTDKGSKIIGRIGEIESLKTEYDIHSVVIAQGEKLNEGELFEIIAKLYPLNVDIHFTPRIYEILTGTAQIKRLNMSPLVSITKHKMSDWQLSTKRFFDISVSLLSLLTFMPLMLCCALAIRWDSKGSIFYKQERIGKLGRPFKIIKFRTMYEGSENGTPKLSAPTDSRVTRVGHYLRKYRLDELPQFWNVIIGEMSIVGPRPERQYYIDQIAKRAPYYCMTYRIRPGLTSWGPIKIGYSDTVEKMVERLNYDIIYMENMSLLNDMRILFYTIEVILKGKGV